MKVALSRQEGQALGGLPGQIPQSEACPDIYADASCKWNYRLAFFVEVIASRL